MRGEFSVALSDTSNVKYRYGPRRGSPKTTPKIFDAASTVVLEDKAMAKVNRKVMEAHQFTLILTGIKDLTPDVTDALYEAGFDDALIGMAAGVPYIDVNHRQAESLEKAVREAIRDVEKAGFHVVRVESETANAITRINADLLTLSSHS
jgi:hypothetical protein